MLKVMKEYQHHFEKTLIKNCNLEDNINLVKGLIIDEDGYNEDIFLKIQKKFCLYDFFNLSLLFPMKVLNKNGKTLVQLISEDTTPNDLELIQAILKNVEQNEMDKLNVFHIENIIFELLDETIRQISVQCPKRGFALILINNEIQKNMKYYKSLIEIIEHNNNMNNEQFRDMQRNYNFVYDLLKHNESLLEKIKEIYDKQGEI
ncbi:conserved Plasmodium protein, unknown function [Plasmodium ovale wallikeri]|uniref:Dynein light chain n=1 Tax=Plasmodium ovale wallikeri TaxID=864142 RepID=A0A1A8ZRY8_PLAOA|nr:conserved Plasmodium protein, unknown function [Plasmodium ovale wallikeri]